MSDRKDSTPEVLELGHELYVESIQKFPPPYAGEESRYDESFSWFRSTLASELLKRGWTLANYDWAADDDSKAYTAELMSRPAEPMSHCTVIHMDGIEDEPEDEL